MERLDPSQRIASRKGKEIYELIRKQDIVSKIALLEQSGMTGSTLTRTLEDLTAQNLIMEAGLGESTGGRKPILYRTNPDYAYVIGLDISRITSKLVLCDMHMNRIDSRRWAMSENSTPEVLLHDVVVQIEDMLRKHKISKESLLGMGIGAVGPLDRHSGTLVKPLYFPAPGWEQLRVVDYFERKLQVPVYLDNGANTAIMAEHWIDRQHDYRHLLYVHLGVGIRTSMISGGGVVYGAVDMEGSIGQMIIQTDGDRINGIGNYGSLDSFVSTHALEELAKARLKQGRASLIGRLAGTPERVTFAHFTEALQQNDSMAVEIFTQASTYFGIGLANLLNILHPEKVILGGPLVNAHPMFFQNSTKVAIQKTYYYPDYQVVFSKGHLGEEALAAGAAIMVINQLTV